MICKKGLAQIVIMVSLLILAIALPVLSKVIKQNQDLRNRAAGEGCGAEGEECCYGLYCNDSLLCFPYYDDKDSSGSGTVVKKICAKAGADVTATPTPIRDPNCDLFNGCTRCNSMGACTLDCSCGLSPELGANNTPCGSCAISPTGGGGGGLPEPSRDPKCDPLIGCLPDCSCGRSSLPGADNNLCLECGLPPEPSRDPKCHPMIGCLPDCSCGRSSLPGADNNLCLPCEEMPEPTPPGATLTPYPSISPTITPSPTLTPIPTEITCPACKSKGDYNCDGKVNGLDYSWWKQEFIDKVQHGGKWEASSDCTVVSLDDYSVWRDNYLK
jgi:hypothetical protein